MVRSPRSGRLEPSGTTVAFILRDAATRLLRMRFEGYDAVRLTCHTCEGYGSAISRHDLPELSPWFSPKRGSRECRMHAAPAVSRAMGRRKRTRAYRFSGGTPAFPAQGRMQAQKVQLDQYGAADVSTFVSRSAGLKIAVQKLPRITPTPRG